MQTAQAIVALGLWGYWSTGGRSPWAIVALAALSGAFSGMMIGSWQAFVSELVPREALLDAVTLNSAQFNAARAFGRPSAASSWPCWDRAGASSSTPSASWR